MNVEIIVKLTGKRSSNNKFDGAFNQNGAGFVEITDQGIFLGSVVCKYYTREEKAWDKLLGEIYKYLVQSKGLVVDWRIAPEVDYINELGFRGYARLVCT